MLCLLPLHIYLKEITLATTLTIGKQPGVERGRTGCRLWNESVNKMLLLYASADSISPLFGYVMYIRKVEVRPKMAVHMYIFTDGSKIAEGAA